MLRDNHWFSWRCAFNVTTIMFHFVGIFSAYLASLEFFPIFSTFIHIFKQLFPFFRLSDKKKLKMNKIFHFIDFRSF